MNKIENNENKEAQQYTKEVQPINKIIMLMYIII
jgi:hypothetical protein